MIRLENINKFYTSGNERIHVIRNLNYTFPDTGLVFILGPSGSGKSTLLNLLGGLDKPDSGEIYIEDRAFSSFSSSERNNYLNSYLGFVFQDYNILKDLTLVENIKLSLSIQGCKRKVAKQKVKDIIDAVELTGLEKRKVSQLSGGQKQRIAIARALVKDPKMIIADEPTGNLDSETSKKIFELFKKLSKDRLIIIVTHDEESALKYSDEILRFDTANVDLDVSSQNEQVVEPNTNKEVTTNNKLVLKRAKIPLATITKLAFKNMWHKKFSYILMFVICTISLAFLSFAIELNGDKLYQNVYTTVNNNVHYTNIYQYNDSQNNSNKDFYDKYQKGKLDDNAYENIKKYASDLTIHKYQSISVRYVTKYQLEKANFLYTGKINTVILYDPTNTYRIYAGRLPNPNEPEILITDFLFESFKHFGLIDKNAQVYDILNRWYDFGLETDLKIVGIVQTEYSNWIKLTNQILYSSEYQISEYDSSFKSFAYDYLLMNSIIIGDKYYDIVCCEGIDLRAGKIDTEDFFTLDEQFVKNYSTEEIYFGKAPNNENEIMVPLCDLKNIYNFSDSQIEMLADTTNTSEQRDELINKILTKPFTLKLSYGSSNLTNDSYNVIINKSYNVVGVTNSNNYLLNQEGYQNYIYTVELIKNPRTNTDYANDKDASNFTSNDYTVYVRGKLLDDREIVLYQNENLRFGSAPIGSDEIIIPLAKLREIIDLDDWQYYLLTTDNELWWRAEEEKKMLQQQILNSYAYVKNEFTSININGVETPVSIIKKYRIAGVTTSDNFYLSIKGCNEFIAATQVISNLKLEENILVELSNNPETVLKQFNSLYNSKYHYIIDIFQYKDEIESYNIDPLVEFLSKGGLIVFTILTIGIMWTVFTIEIVDSKKEIGIMRSIGLSGFKVSLIFVIQMFFVNLLAYGASIPLAKLAIDNYGSNITDPLEKVKLSLYTMTYRSPLYLGLFVLIITIIATFVPLIKIMSQKIINVINEREE